MIFRIDEHSHHFLLQHMVNAGYAGSNIEAVREHVKELSTLGVAAPNTVPTFYPVPLQQLTQAEMIQVPHDCTSAEVEYVNLFIAGKHYISVGSDHSDRALEGYSVASAKQICPNIISDELWEYSEVADHLHQVVLKCEVGFEDKWIVYQQGTLSDLLTPDLLMQYGAAVMPAHRDGLVVYSGTIPLVGDIIYSDQWRVSMHDEVSGRKMSKEYEVEVLPPSIT